MFKHDLIYRRPWPSQSFRAGHGLGFGKAGQGSSSRTLPSVCQAVSPIRLGASEFLSFTVVSSWARLWNAGTRPALLAAFIQLSSLTGGQGYPETRLYPSPALRWKPEISVVIAVRRQVGHGRECRGVLSVSRVAVVSL